MESILVVSPDEWITEAVQRLDKTRFSVAVSDYDSALDTCLEALPVEGLDRSGE